MLRCLSITENLLEYGIGTGVNQLQCNFDSLFAYTLDEKDWGYRWIFKIETKVLICLGKYG